MTRKLFIRFTAAMVLFALILGGCSTKSNNHADTATNTSSSTPAASNTDTATATASATPASGDPVTIRFYLQDGEISEDQIAAFNAAHPNINLMRVDTDFNKLIAQISANSATMPDLIRVNANEFPFYAARNLALNLQPYFDASTVFKKDDLLDIIDMFRWDGKNQGTGDLYGIVKDWQPEMDMYINKKLFAEAGIPLPDDKTAMTWDQLADYAKKLTKKDGDKVIQWGFTDPFVGGVLISQAKLQYMLASSGQQLYSDDYSTILLDSPEAKQYLQYWIDLAKAEAGPSMLYPEANSFIELFTQDKLAMMVAGYWFGGVLRSTDSTKDHLDDYMLLPAPKVAGGTAIEASQVGTGAIINSRTRHPDEAWTVFEWFFGGQPAEDRAASGWGLPVTQSMMSLLPTATNFDKQTYGVVMDSISHLSTIKNNPYISTMAIDAVLNKYFTPVYFDQDTLDGAIEKSKKEIEIQIRENKDIVGAE